VQPPPLRTEQKSERTPLQQRAVSVVEHDWRVVVGQFVPCELVVRGREGRQEERNAIGRVHTELEPPFPWPSGTGMALMPRTAEARTMALVNCILRDGKLGL
jgi:hypothetical protein